MGKKKAIVVLKGSLRQHWIKYITSLNLDVNVADTYGMGTATGLMRMMTTIDTKYLQPGFQYKFNIHSNLPYRYPSLMHLKFVNGYEKKYDIGANPLNVIKHEIAYINDVVEFERSFNGQDDEMDDEV